MRAITVFLGVFLSSALLTSSLVAQKPDKQPLQYEPLEFDASVVCGFPVLIEGSGHQSVISFLSGREMIVGSGSTRITNVATGQSIVLSSTGHFVQTPLPDGTVRLTANGQSLFFLLPQDVTGPGLIFTTGHIELAYDIATDSVTSVSSEGTTLDVCAAL